MTNSKPKVTTESPLGRLRDEILFVRHFRYVTDQSPDSVHDTLQSLAYQPDSLTRVFFPRQRLVEMGTLEDGIQLFTIKTKVGGLYTELTATGTIRYDSATGETIVSGRITFDAVYLAVLLTGLFVLITWGLASLSRTSIIASPFILFTLGLTNLFYFRQMFHDRNNLLTTLSQALTTRDAKRAHDRLAEKPMQTQSDEYLSQPKSQHSQETS